MPIEEAIESFNDFVSNYFDFLIIKNVSAQYLVVKIVNLLADLTKMDN